MVLNNQCLIDLMTTATTTTSPSTSAANQLPVEIGLDDSKRETIIEMLKGSLADQHVLYISYRNFHWNVVGPTFQQLHELYEDIYKELAESIDDTAERIRTYGSEAPGSMAEFLSLTRLNEHKGTVMAGENTLRALLPMEEQVIQQLRKDIAVAEEIGDAGVADFLTARIQAHEKTLWMLRSHLDG